jgi:hypothetical protein
VSDLARFFVILLILLVRCDKISEICCAVRVDAQESIFQVIRMDLWDEVWIVLDEVNEVLRDLFLILEWDQDVEVLLPAAVLQWGFYPLILKHVCILDLPVKEGSNIILLLLEVLLMPCFIGDHLDFETVTEFPLKIFRGVTLGQLSIFNDADFSSNVISFFNMLGGDEYASLFLLCDLLN